MNNIGMVLALIATGVVVVLMLVFSVHEEVSPPKKDEKFDWVKTDFVDEEQIFGPVLDGDPITYNDAGLYSGQDSVYLGQLVVPEAVTVLDSEDNWMHCENKSKSLQMELYDSGNGLYVQSLRTCSAYVPTIRGVYVGMPIAEAMGMFPGYADVESTRNEVQIVADDTVILFKVDKKDKISEICMKFKEA